MRGSLSSAAKSIGGRASGAVLLCVAAIVLISVFSSSQAFGADASVKVEQSDSRLSYAGSWSTYSTASASGASYKRANTSGSSVTIGFNGTSLTWIATKGTSMGKADVSVDGGTAVTIDLAASSGAYQQRVFSTGTLAAGYHQVKISWNRGNVSGKYISLDAVEVAGSLVQVSRLQQTHSSVNYSGSWYTFSTSGASGGSYARTNVSGASAKVTFDGVRLDWIATKGTTLGKARVSVDGRAAVTVDLASSDVQYQQSVWNTGYLTPGTHTVTISRDSNNVAGKYVSVDSLDVTRAVGASGDPGSTTSTTTPAPPTASPDPTTWSTSLPVITGKTYYVDAVAGSDTNTGLSPSTAWKTVAKTNRTFAPGDAILFKSGQTFRGTLRAVGSGTPSAYIVYGAYGTGAKPLILGSVDLSASTRWSSQGGNIWRATGLSMDIGNLILSNESSCGQKKSSRASCTLQGDFYYNATGQYLELYSTSNPGTYYTRIEAAQKQHGFYDGGANYVLVQNLSFKYFGGHGAQINSGGTHDVIVECCDFAWIGGSYLSGTTRYGNGIEMYESVNNVTIRYNKVSQTFDEGITLQGYNASQASDIYVHHNVVVKCKAGISAYYHGNPNNISNIYILNNTVFNTGGGWSNSINVRCGFYSSGFQNSTVTNCHFNNNIIHTSVGRALIVWKPADEVAPGWTFDYNCYYPDSSSVFEYNSGNFVSFSGWKSLTLQETHSYASDPRFLNAATGDFRLASGSPCTATGLVLPNAGQSATSLPNIGAY